MTENVFDPESPEARILAGARRGFSPTPADLERVFGGLSSAFEAVAESYNEPTARTERPALAPDPASLAHQGGASLFSIKALIASSVVSLAIGFGAGFGVHQAIEVKDPIVQAQATTVIPSAPPALGSEQRLDGPDMDEQPLIQPKSPAPRRPPATPGTIHSSTPTAQLSPYDELNTVRNAQSALKAGDAMRALGLLNELRTRAKGGGLWAERGMIEVLALCHLHRADEARSLAESLLKRAPQFPYAQRLRGSCALQVTGSEQELTRARESQHSTENFTTGDSR